jgi:hypothetical protein
VKLLKKTLGEMLQETERKKDFSYRTPKSQETKTKIDKWVMSLSKASTQQKK